MERLFIAIKALWDGTSGATVRGLATGGLHLALAPHGTALPYVVMFPIASNPGGTMTTTNVSGYIEDSLIQFSVQVAPYALTTGYQIVTALKSLLDNQFLQFDSGTDGHVILVRRRNSGSQLIVTDPDAGHTLILEYQYQYDEK